MRCLIKYGILLIAITLVGCALSENEAQDPNSTSNKAAKTFEENKETLYAVGGILPGIAGTIWSIGVGVATGAVGLWNNYKKKLTIVDKDENLSTTTDTAKRIGMALDAIVGAIDESEKVAIGDTNAKELAKQVITQYLESKGIKDDVDAIIEIAKMKADTVEGVKGLVAA